LDEPPILSCLVTSQNFLGIKWIDMCCEILKKPIDLDQFEWALEGLKIAWKHHLIRRKDIANAMIGALLSPQTQLRPQVAFRLSEVDLGSLSLESEKLGKAYILMSYYLGAPLFVEGRALYLFIKQEKRKVMDSIDENLLAKWKNELFFKPAS